MSLDGDEAEEKSRLIQQVFQLQNTLDGMELHLEVFYDLFLIARFLIVAAIGK